MRSPDCPLWERKYTHTHTQSVILDAPLFRFRENRTDIVLRARTGVCYLCVLKRYRSVQHDENPRLTISTEIKNIFPSQNHYVRRGLNSLRYFKRQIYKISISNVLRFTFRSM